MKLDILAFGAHPDDVDLSCAGVLLKHAAMGKKTGIVDLTMGQLGTRGSAELRLVEAENAAKILKVSVRDNLKMEDGYFVNDSKHQLEIIKKIRQYQPEIILANAIYDRHPDHGKASQLVSEACFYSGLRKIETELNGKKQQAWRPKAVYHYIQFKNIEPHFAVDVTEFMEEKMQAIKAFSSQFYDPNSKEPETVISSKDYLNHIYQRASDMGRIINAKYAEGFTVERYPGVENLFHLT
ncbi:MAG TPA: bacillithiol biosynthesis deacetylase BshB1 [Bacteroidia bacterium]|nr:bacillithiol biosynthesis deacetylase BshB1 [Bacteroidia bacterium]